MPSPGPLLLALGISLALAGPPPVPDGGAGAPACGTTWTWDGSVSNEWSDPDNWTSTGSGFPDGPTDCVVVPTSGWDPTFDVDVTVLDLDLTGAAAVTGCAGRMLQVAGTFTMGSTAPTPLFTEAGPPCSSSGEAVLRIQPGGVLEKTSSGTSAVELVVDDDGSVVAPGGPLHLLMPNDGAGSVVSTGSFGSATGDVVGLGGGLDRSYVMDGATLGGNVSIGIPGAGPGGNVSAATVEVTGTVVALGENTLVGSVLTGSGTFVVSGSDGLLHWANDGTGGTRQDGAGVTHVQLGAELRVDGAIGVSLEGTRTIWNEGLIRLTAGGYIAADDATLLRNDGTFRIENDLGYYEGTVIGGGDFVNDGVVTKTAGTGVSIIDADYSGSGDENVLSGTLQIWGQGDDGLEGSLALSRVLGTGSTAVPVIDDDPGAPVTDPSALPFSSTVRNRVAKRRFTIAEQTPGPPPFVGRKVVVTAPGRTTAGVKAAVTLRIRADQLEPGDTPADYVVLNVGKAVPRCTSLSPPTPTLCKRGSILGNGDLQFVVYTSAVVDTPSLQSGPSKRCCTIKLKRCCTSTEAAVRDRGAKRAWRRAER